MKELITDINYIIEFALPGFIFVVLFVFVSQRKSTSAKNLVIAGIVASSIERSILLVILRENDIQDWHIAILCIFSLLSGILFGSLFISDKFNDFIHKIHIKTTTRTSIWDDIIKDKTWVMIYLENQDIFCVGQVEYHHNENGTTYLSLINFYFAKRFGEEYGVLKDDLIKENSLLTIDVSKHKIIMTGQKDFLNYYIETTHK